MGGGTIFLHSLDPGGADSILEAIPNGRPRPEQIMTTDQDQRKWTMVTGKT
jgi:hypothetical protein